MKKKEKLELFLKLINCNYDLYLWEYDSQLNFLHSDWKECIFAGNFLSYTGLAGLAREHLNTGKHTPVILEAPANLMWMAGFQCEEDQLKMCYFIGPIYSGRDSHLLLRKHMDSYDLTIKLRSSITKIFEHIPTIPGNILSQYTIMLHYCLNGTKITTTDISYLSTIPSNTSPSSSESTFSDHAGIWYSEQQLIKMLSEGNPRYKEALHRSSSLSSGVKAQTGDALRQHKNNALVLLTLCSRACINGGLAPATSYDLNDHYATRLEECSSLTAVQKLTEAMLEDYVSRVREAQRDTQISSQLQSTCAYIKANITTPLSIKSLAERCGYSEYYFSHKFNKEVGITVNDYIVIEKIEQAKLLLAGTTDSIQTISDTLLFGNRSYFYSCFRKQTGLSPSEYRVKHQKV